ncbi:hypothetical protein IWQ60_000699 [Tieghemiomyces parasiticus]|uniref:RlpA-like protein double-psi beta-barrel domain-containing protein n=1 Tax=Tieghemiomyces parasiticus TaxID=78921 RepID=A0A9W8E2H9_9FUNG|nr:hypothetical protein IWQ60_000699 [Tieghemiomyces parasiticus]
MVSFTKTAMFFATAAAGLAAVEANPANTRVVYETVTNWVTTTVAPTAAVDREAESTPTADSTNADSSGGSGEEFTGEGTYYSPSVGLGACGLQNSDSDFVAALNAPQFGSPANPNSNPLCGKKALVKGPKGSVTVTIVDKCPPCKSGDLDLSVGAFDQIADQAEGRVPISWSWVE